MRQSSEPAQTAQRGPSPDQLQRPLLAWVATQISRGEITHGALPSAGAIPAQYIPASQSQADTADRARRWAIILLTVRERPAACGRVLATDLLADGFSRTSVNAALAMVEPRPAGTRWQVDPDPDYARAELEHYSAPTAGSKLALAYAASRHDLGFAAQLAVQAQELAPDDYRVDVCMGSVAERGGRYAAAADHYAAAVRKGCTDCFDAWARSLNRAGKHQTALNVADQAPSQTPSLTLERARAARAIASPRLALELYRSISPRTLDDPAQAAAEAAECHLALGLDREAIEAAQEPATTGNALALRVLGIAHYHARHWREAVDALLAYLGRTPDDAEAWIALAWSQLSCGSLPEAVEAGNTALRLDTSRISAASAVAQALVLQRRFREAIQLCRVHGAAILPYSYLFQAFVEAAEPEQAADLARRWVQGRPNDAEAWLAMGYLAERMARYQDAVTYYTQAMRVAPDNQQARERWQRLSNAIENDLLPGMDEDRVPPPGLPAAAPQGDA